MDFAVTLILSTINHIFSVKFTKYRTVHIEGRVTGPGKAEKVKLIALLEGKSDAILDGWFKVVAETYPDETTRFLGDRKNRFANPVGHAIRQGLKGLLGGLLRGEGAEAMAPHLDEIVRIRAVQKFDPSRAVSFIFDLKTILRKEAAKQGEGDLSGELATLEDGVDRLALQAFDNYMACRETLFNIRIKEIKDSAAIQSRNMRKEASGHNRGNTLHGKNSLGGGKDDAR